MGAEAAKMLCLGRKVSEILHGKGSVRKVEPFLKRARTKLVSSRQPTRSSEIRKVK